jgi:hypothetical protein
MSDIAMMKLNTYLVRIEKALAYMPLDKYTQWASGRAPGRLYVKRGCGGGISISSKSVTILAQGVCFYNKITMDDWPQIIKIKDYRAV